MKRCSSPFSHCHWGNSRDGLHLPSWLWELDLNGAGSVSRWRRGIGLERRPGGQALGEGTGVGCQQRAWLRAPPGPGAPITQAPGSPTRSPRALLWAPNPTSEPPMRANQSIAATDSERSICDGAPAGRSVCWVFGGEVLRTPGRLRGRGEGQGQQGHPPFSLRLASRLHHRHLTAASPSTEGRARL